mgnify:CR=1 FL=1
MNNLFEKLCNKAGSEEIPKVDIADKTISLISSNAIETQWFWDKPLMWVAALSSAAAIPFAVMAIMLNNTSVSPLVEISQIISWVI